MNFKKKAQAIQLGTLGILGVLGFLVYIVMAGGSASVDIPNTMDSVGVPDMRVTVTEAMSDVSIDEPIEGSNNYQVIINEDALNTVNDTAITFTMVSRALNGKMSPMGTYIDHNVVYTFEASKLAEINDPSQLNYPTQWISSSKGYNVSVVAESTTFDAIQTTQASEVVKLGDQGSAVVTLNVEDSTTILKSIEDQYATVSVGTITASIDDQKYATVDVVVRKTSA
jgi:hypothetical protein